MISFDDITGSSDGSVNLAPIYSSLSYLLNCCSSVQNSITNLINNTSYFNNLLYDATTSINSIMSDTSSIWDYVSTLSGGGGGGGGDIFKTLDSNLNQNEPHWFVRSVNSDVELPSTYLTINIATMIDCFNSKNFSKKYILFKDETSINNVLNGNTKNNIEYSKYIKINNAFNSNSSLDFINGYVSVGSGCFRDNPSAVINLNSIYLGNPNWSSIKQLTSYINVRDLNFRNNTTTFPSNTFGKSIVLRDDVVSFKSLPMYLPSSLSMYMLNGLRTFNEGLKFNTGMIFSCSADKIQYSNVLYNDSEFTYYCQNYCNENVNVFRSNTSGVFTKYNFAHFANNFAYQNSSISQIYDAVFYNQHLFDYYLNEALTDIYLIQGGINSLEEFMKYNDMKTLNLIMPHVEQIHQCFDGNTFDYARINLPNKMKAKTTYYNQYAMIYNTDLEYNIHANEEVFGLPTILNDYQTVASKTIFEEIAPDMDILKYQKLQDCYHNLNELNKATVSLLSMNNNEVGKQVGHYFQMPNNHYDAYYINTLKPIMNDATFCYFRQHGLFNYASEMPKLSWACLSNSGGEIDNGTNWLMNCMGLNWSAVIPNMKELKRLDIYYNPQTYNDNIQIKGFRDCQAEKINFNISVVNGFDKHVRIGPNGFINCKVRDFNVNLMGNGDFVNYTYDQYAFSDCKQLRDINLNAIFSANAFVGCCADNFYINWGNIDALTNPQQWDYPTRSHNPINLYVIGMNSSQTITNSDLTKFATFFGSVYTRLKIHNIYEQGF